MTVRIYCINKDAGNHENPYVAISYLGWVNPANVQVGRSTRLDMYTFVKANPNGAYVETSAGRTYLIGDVSVRGNPYVKTEANDTTRDNLLKLPECG
jgi:hypothetical protein